MPRIRVEIRGRDSKCRRFVGWLGVDRMLLVLACIADPSWLLNVSSVDDFCAPTICTIPT